jgi:hypothetical protein
LEHRDRVIGGDMADRDFYRIVQTDPPTANDFLSNQGKGLPQRAGESAEIWSGLSHYETAELARKTALRYPQIGRFIAMVRVTDDSGFRVEQTFRAGHYTIWGDPEALLAAAVAIQPIERPDPDAF